MTDKMDLNDNVCRRALRATAEDQVGKSPDTTLELKDKTPEEIIHELHVHQIELEIQNEELKRVQLELEESRDKYQHKYQDLYDFAPIGYFTVTHKGIIRDVNLAGASLLVMPRSKLIGRGFGHFVAPESLDQWDQHIINVLGHEENQNCDLTLRSEDGSSFFARLESIRMHAPAGLPEVSQGTYLVSIAVIDISERKIAEESLKEAGAFLNTLLNAIPVPLFYKDKEGLYIGFNKAYEEFYGRHNRSLSARVCSTSPRETWQKYTTQRISNSFIIQALRSTTPKSRTPVALFTMWFSTSPPSWTSKAMFAD
jgi:PAS domain S-box-containing protein